MRSLPGNPGPKTRSLIPFVVPIKDAKEKIKRRKGRKRKVSGWDGKIRIGK